MNFALPEVHRVKIKESEKITTTCTLTENKKPVENEGNLILILFGAFGRSTESWREDRKTGN